MGMMHHLFKSKDIDRRVKYWICLAAPVNTLPWGAKSWNLSKMNQNKLATFHHSAIWYILNIKWEQMREQKISNEEVRRRFENIPEINFFITRQTWTYIGKIVHAPEYSIPKKLIGAWEHCPRKAGHPQSSSKKHFLTALKTVLPEIGKQGRFQEWYGLVHDESKWEEIFNSYMKKIQKN